MCHSAGCLGLQRINDGVESLEADRDKVEDGADGGDVLEVEHEPAHDPVQRPDEGEQGGQLDRQADQDQEEVRDGEVGQERVGGRAEGLPLDHCDDDQNVSNNTQEKNYSKITNHEN